MWTLQDFLHQNQFGINFKANVNIYRISTIIFNFCIIINGCRKKLLNFRSTFIILNNIDAFKLKEKIWTLNCHVLFIFKYILMGESYHCNIISQSLYVFMLRTKNRWLYLRIMANEQNANKTSVLNVAASPVVSDRFETLLGRFYIVITTN